MKALLIILILLGVIQFIKIITAIVNGIAKHDKNYDGLESSSLFTWNCKDSVRLLPTIEVFNWHHSKFFEISIQWMWFEYYVCFTHKYVER